MVAQLSLFEPRLPPALDWHTGWLTATDALLAALTDDVAWESKRTTSFGGHVLPRLTRWYGPSEYVCSGTRNAPTPWTPELMGLRHRLAAELSIAFNACLLNLYRSGEDSVGWHADDEAELGDPSTSTVATVVLGARRSFQIRDNKSGETTTIEPGHGDLVLMLPPCQATHRHQVPRRLRVTKPRISLTFRYWV